MEVQKHSVWRKIGLLLAAIAAVIFLCGADGDALEEQATTDEAVAALFPKKQVAVITCKDMIDDGLYQSIIRRTEEAIGRGADYVIYQIETYGGLVKSADDISKYLILEVGDRVDTVAYITTEAISAGAWVSVSCRDILMRPNTKIGDCAPVSLGGELKDVEREKTESFIRAAFRTAAEANGYPVALLEAMVTQRMEVVQVENVQTGEMEYFEVADLPNDPNLYNLKDKKVVVSSEELLTLTSSQAEEFGIARALADDVDEVVAYLADRDNVEIAPDILKLEPLWSEQMVRWLNSPAVMSVLVLLAMVGIYVEFNTPGLGLPGLVAVIAIITMVGSKYLIGMANWVEVAVFVVGLLLLIIEVFVIPGFGVAGVLGILCIFSGLFGMLIKNPPERLPWPQTDFDWNLLTTGILSILVGVIGFVIVASLIAKYLPKIEFLSGLILVPSTDAAQTKMVANVTAPPESQGMQVSVGDRGRVLGPLRPAGTAEFDDRVVDVVTRGEFLERGATVQIDEIHGNRVVVRKVDE